MEMLYMDLSFWKTFSSIARKKFSVFCIFNDKNFLINISLMISLCEKIIVVLQKKSKCYNGRY